MAHLTDRLHLDLPNFLPETPGDHNADWRSLERWANTIIWELPWGQAGGSQVSDGTGAAIGTTLTDIIQITVPVILGRRYHVNATTNMFSPGGAGNYAMLLYIDGAQIESVEARPSNTYGTAVHINDSIYEPATTHDAVFLIKAQFTAGGGTVLYDGNRYRRLVVDDVGPVNRG